MLPLCGIVLTNGIRRLKQCDGLRVFGNQHIAEVLRQTGSEIAGIEAFLQDFVQQQQRTCYIVCEGKIHHAEIVVGIKHIQHLDGTLVGNGIAAERDELVEDTERIAHTAICLLRHHIQGFIRYIDTFFLRNMLQMGNRIGNGDTREVIHLASAENSRQYLVFLGGCQDEDSIRRRLLQGLQKGVERTGRKHMHLVNDIDGILTYLWRDTHLVNERADVFNRVVGGCIQFMDIEGASFVERTAGLTLVAGVVP